MICVVCKQPIPEAGVTYSSTQVVCRYGGSHPQQTRWIPTLHLRYVKRDLLVPNGLDESLAMKCSVNVLQQAFRQEDSMKLQWRDVPCVDEPHEAVEKP